MVRETNSHLESNPCRASGQVKRCVPREGLAAGEGDDRGWDGWMASLTRRTWVSVNSGSWWWTGRPGVLRFMGSQRVGHDWVTDLIEINSFLKVTKNFQMFKTRHYISIKENTKSWSRVVDRGFPFAILSGALFKCLNIFVSSVFIQIWLYAFMVL